MNGIVFDIKRFAVHDGKGIRTTLFLKGCPLRCPWCQNPEGLDPDPMILHDPARCLHCGRCVQVCSKEALALTVQIYVNYNLCDICGRCAASCPSAAIRMCGEVISAEQAVRQLLRDRAFYNQGGGVTLSGGEIFLQWQFAKEVLSGCHQEKIDTAIETSLYVSRPVLESLLPVVDHFFVDIKLFDRLAHQSVIGVDNQIILDNYRYLVSQGADTIVRTPLIPGYTATDENISCIASFLYQIDPNTKYELLNFNPLCRSKYEAMNHNYPVSASAFSQDELTHYYQVIEQTGLRSYKEE